MGWSPTHPAASPLQAVLEPVRRAAACWQAGRGQGACDSAPGQEPSEHRAGSWGLWHPCAVFSRSAVSDSLRPYGLWPARLLCPWGFFRQEYWSGLPCLSPEHLPNQGIEPRSPHCGHSLPLDTPRHRQCALTQRSMEGFPRAWVSPCLTNVLDRPHCVIPHVHTRPSSRTLACCPRHTPLLQGEGTSKESTEHGRSRCTMRVQDQTPVTVQWSKTLHPLDPWFSRLFQTTPSSLGSPICFPLGQLHPDGQGHTGHCQMPKSSFSSVSQFSRSVVSDSATP